MKRTLAKALATALIWCAPGLAPYAAFAQMRGGVLIEGPVLEGGFQAAPVVEETAVQTPAIEAGLPAATEGLEQIQGRISEARTLDAQLRTAERTSARSVSRGVTRETAQTRTVRGLAAATEKPEGGAAKQGPDRIGALFDQATNKAGASEPAQQGGGEEVVDVTGKRFLLIGTLDTRPFLTQDPARVAKETGVKLVVIDKAERRHLWNGVVADEDFIAADVDDHSEANTRTIVDKAAFYALNNPVDYAYSFLNAYASLASKVGEAIGATSNSAAAMEAAETKSMTRNTLKGTQDETPSARVATAAEAKARFAEIAGAGGKVVLKPIKGGGSQGVEKNITADTVEEVFAKVDKNIRDFMKRPQAGSSNLDQHPGILMERQLVGPEVDVEIVRDVKGRVVFGHVSDNPPMEGEYAVEKGATYPSQLSAAMRAEMIEAANRILDALEKEYGKMVGNFHVEMIYTPEGPKLLEVNPRMGGLFVYKLVKRVTGMSLVEAGMKALMGIQVPAAHEPTFTAEVRMALVKTSGKLEAIEGVEKARSMPGIVELTMLKKAGDDILAAPDDMFDYPLYIEANAPTYAEAMAQVAAAMKEITLSIRKADGTLVSYTADYLHKAEDPNKELEDAKKGAGSVQGQGREAGKAEKVVLPKSFWTYMAGVGTYAAAQESIAITAPLFAAGAVGIEFAVITQALSIASRIPGSVLGAKFIRKLDSRKVYMVANVLNALTFLSIPLVQIFIGGGSTEHIKPLIQGLFVAFSIMAGLAYGATRGVAEQEILPRIVGQDEKALEKANSLFFVIIEPLAFSAAFGIGALILATSGTTAAIVGGAVLALSAIPFSLIKYKQQTLAAKAVAVKSEGEDKLPLKMYVPFVFSQASHQAFYGLLAPFFAMELFKNGAFAGNMIGAYDMGSFALAALLTFLPALAPKWTAKGWTVAGVLPIVGFLWASILVGTPMISAGLAGLYGVATTVMNIKWKKTYQQRLKLEAQPKVFQWLSIASVIAVLIPFAMIKGSAVAGLAVSMTTMLTVVAALMTVGAIATLMTLKSPKDKSENRKS